MKEEKQDKYKSWFERNSENDFCNDSSDKNSWFPKDLNINVKVKVEGCVNLHGTGCIELGGHGGFKVCNDGTVTVKNEGCSTFEHKGEPTFRLDGNVVVEGTKGFENTLYGDINVVGKDGFKVEVSGNTLQEFGQLPVNITGDPTLTVTSDHLDLKVCGTSHVENCGTQTIVHCGGANNTLEGDVKVSLDGEGFVTHGGKVVNKFTGGVEHSSCGDISVNLKNGCPAPLIEFGQLDVGLQGDCKDRCNNCTNVCCTDCDITNWVDITGTLDLTVDFGTLAGVVLEDGSSIGVVLNLPFRDCKGYRAATGVNAPKVVLTIVRPDAVPVIVTSQISINNTKCSGNKASLLIDLLLSAYINTDPLSQPIYFNLSATDNSFLDLSFQECQLGIFKITTEAPIGNTNEVEKHIEFGVSKGLVELSYGPTEFQATNITASGSLNAPLNNLDLLFRRSPDDGVVDGVVSGQWSFN